MGFARPSFLVMRYRPDSISYSGNVFVSVARRPRAIVCSAEYPQPGGQGANAWKNRGPRIAFAFSTFRTKSSGNAMFTVAAYAGSCAATIPMMSFLISPFPLDVRVTGVVVVRAPRGVAPLRWTPVFMYASLSYIT